MNKPTPKRLLRLYDTVNPKTLEDLIYCAALNVEAAMLTGGLKPGVDYKALDLYQLGVPVAMKLWDDITDRTFLTGDPSQ